MALMWLAGCLDLDPFVHNGVTCGVVGPDTCANSVWDNVWDRVCVPCDEAYDWEQAYPWFDTMLDEGESVRPIPNASVVRQTVPTADGAGALDTYFVPGHGEVPELVQTTVFYNHGNYAGIEPYIPRIRVLHELGYSVFAWDYRGYGKSEPATYPTAEEFLADARQMRAHVQSVAPDPERIVVYGYSLGGIPAIEAAVAQPGCALVLETPFPGAAEITRLNASMAMPESFLSAGGFENVKKIEAYPGPVLGMVGSDDGRFPPAGLEEILDHAPGPTELWVLPGVHHGISDGGVVEAGMRPYGDRILGFLAERTPDCLAP